MYVHVVFFGRFLTINYFEKNSEMLMNKIEYGIMRVKDCVFL